MTEVTDKRDFLCINDLMPHESGKIFDITRALKAAPKGAHVDLLRGRAVAVVLEKASTRTRVSFEVGISQLGAQPVILGLEGSQLGRGEPIKDTARVLSRYVDAIAYRTSKHERLVEMAESASVPVLNALSDVGHPIQVMCDVFTIIECFGRELGIDQASIVDRKIAFVGDCSSNMALSWLEAAPFYGFQLALSAPPGYYPPYSEIQLSKGHVTICNDPLEAVAGADVVNTDVWASMGQEAEADVRRAAFSGFTVDDAMLQEIAPHGIVLHCLPAHRGEEISDAVIEGPRSRVWDQAENRLHVQKGLLCWLLGVDVPWGED